MDYIQVTQQPILHTQPVSETPAEQGSMTVKILAIGNNLELADMEGNVLHTYNYVPGDQASIADALTALKQTADQMHYTVTNAGDFNFGMSPVVPIESCGESFQFGDQESLLEFEMFNVKRRDLMSFDAFMKSMEKAGSIQPLGKKPGKFETGYRRQITRNPMFNHPAFDLLYKGMGIDYATDKEKKEFAKKYGTTPEERPHHIGKIL